MNMCSYCTHRIQEAKYATKVKAGKTNTVKIPADSFKTACQQACPADAIVFGDISNPESKVSKVRQQPRNYRLLEYLNVEPRVSYQARIRNPNPHMPDAEKVGTSQFEKHEAHRAKKGGEA